jgi:hypothetical protein
MGRTSLTFSEAELNRPAKFMVVVADRNIDTHIIDIEEATRYVERFHRRAIIVSSKEIFKNKELSLLKYNFVMNATSLGVRLIDHCGQSYKMVYDYLNGNFKNGLCIAHDDTITNNIADALAQNKGNGMDYIIYRQDLMQLSGNERMSMNFIRFHANADFAFTKDNFKFYSEKFDQNIAIGIFVSQMMANNQYNISQQYFKEQSEAYKELGFNDCIDYYQLNKQMAYHVYYDVSKSKILGMSGEEIKEHMEMVFTAIADKPLYNKASELAVFYTVN